MKNKKITIIPLMVLIALATIGFTYALLSQTLTISGTATTGELEWEIVQGYTINLDHGNDWNASYYPEATFIQLDKDVGCTNVTEIDSDGDGDLDTLEVNMTNVYPWYGEHIAFRIHCTGTIPLKIWKVVFKVDDTVITEIYERTTVLLDLNGDGKNDISIWWGNNFGLQMEPCEHVDLSFDIIVLQDCPEGADLTFKVEFMAIQWNEYESNVP